MERLKHNKFVFFYLLLFITSLIYLTGCNSTQGRRTLGKIYIDRPEVFTRERLVSRRYDKQQWLEDKLDKEILTSYQGYRDVRIFKEIYSKQNVKFDPLQGKLDAVRLDTDIKDVKRKGELDEINHTIQVLKLQNDLKKLKDTTGQNSNDQASANDENVQDTNPNALNDLKVEMTKNMDTKIETVNKEISDLKEEINNAKEVIKSGEGLPTPNPTKTKVELTAIEQLRDQLAYRDAVEAELRQVELDDTHDLLGFTIYTLKFDITVAPGDNTQALGQVELELVTEPKHDFSKVSTKLDKLPFKKETFKQEGLDSSIVDYDHKQKRLIFDVGKTTDLIKNKLLGLNKKNDEAYKDAVNNIPKLVESNEMQITEYYITRHGDFLKKWRNSLIKDINDEALGLQRRLEMGNLADDDTIKIALDKDINTEGNDKQALCQLIINRYKDPIDNFFKLTLNDETVTLDNKEYYLIRVDEFPEFTKPRDGTNTELNNWKDKWKKIIEAFIAIKAYHKIEDKSFVYTIEPKEYAQNISDVAAVEKLKTFILSLKATLPQYGLGLDSYNKYIKHTQSILHGIMRKPLAVGYINDEKKFGWILGPKFNIDEEGRLFFQHTPVQHSFQVSVVVPAFKSSLILKGHYKWLNKDGNPLNKESEENKLFGGKELRIPLPGDFSSHTALVTNKYKRRRVPNITPRWEPNELDDLKMRKILVQAGTGSDLLIRGYDLWRNPEVFIGHQKAEKVDILPDMNGIVAHFNKIIMPPVLNKDKEVETDLIVVTSNGADTLKNEVIIIPAENLSKTKQSVKFIGTRGIKDKKIWVLATAELIPNGFYSIRLSIRPTGAGHWEYLNGIPDEIEGNKNITKIPFKLALEWNSAWGQEEIMAEMQGKLLLKLRESSLETNISKPDIINGTFVYFKEEKLSKANLDPATIKYFSEQENGLTTKIKLKENITIKLTNKSMFYKAYPNLNNALESKKHFKLHFSEGEERGILEVDNSKIVKFDLQSNGASTINIKIKDLVLDSSSKDGLKWIFDKLADNKKHEFSLSIEHGNEKLPVKESLVVEKGT